MNNTKNDEHNPSRKDQVMLISGASSGLGRGVAEAMAADGMSLVLVARRAERLEELADQLGREHVLPLALDVSDPEAAERMVAASLERFGRLDAVFNGAGSMHAGKIEDLDLEAAGAMMRANFEGATRLAYAALRHFRETNSGTLINISSILGTKVRPNAGIYAGTKFAIEALSEALRMEVAGSGIRISVIQPGVTESELQDHFPVHPRELLGITQPLHPEDVARCVRFILDQPPHVRIPSMMILPGEQAM